MLPVGYLFKHVALRPEWIKASHVEDIYSLASCISDNFADYINYWRHNGYWLFDSPTIIEVLAENNGIDLTGCTPFITRSMNTSTMVKAGKSLLPSPRLRQMYSHRRQNIWPVMMW